MLVRNTSNMAATRYQRALEAKREANARSLLYSLPFELLVMICQFLFQPALTNLDRVHLFLCRQPALCKSRHTRRCSQGRHFHQRIQKQALPSPTTLWHLMQASSFLRDFARPMYMANTIHLICRQQLLAYQQSVFCDKELGPICPFVTTQLDTAPIALIPLLNFGLYHNRIDFLYDNSRKWRTNQRHRDIAETLKCLINQHNNTWMRSLLQYVKDLSVDRRGDIRLAPDPQYFASNPDLYDLMSKLAQLRQHSRAGLYMLLLPKRNIDYYEIKELDISRSYKEAVENLENRFWEKGARLGRIENVLYTRETGEEHHFDVIPTKEFIASRCNLWEVGIAAGRLRKDAQEAVWLRIFPAGNCVQKEISRA
ncbi:hypothetical protein F5883DRAFT_183698 [Diaporthe sp. PMI_573]|nr:hypothetical protein F5883DRAFT_183698 [Diaporthaceae sp. PMI_573]